MTLFLFSSERIASRFSDSAALMSTIAVGVVGADASDDMVWKFEMFT